MVKKDAALERLLGQPGVPGGVPNKSITMLTISTLGPVARNWAMKIEAQVITAM